MIEVHKGRPAIVLLVAGLGLAVSGCRVGPQYVRPATPTAPSFKEPLPENFKSEVGWEPARPGDAQLKGDWWTLFDVLRSSPFTRLA